MWFELKFTKNPVCSEQKCKTNHSALSTLFGITFINSWNCEINLLNSDFVPPSSFLNESCFQDQIIDAKHSSS